MKALFHRSTTCTQSHFSPRTCCCRIVLHRQRQAQIEGFHRYWLQPQQQNLPLITRRTYCSGCGVQTIRNSTHCARKRKNPRHNSCSSSSSSASIYPPWTPSSLSTLFVQSSPFSSSSSLSSNVESPPPPPPRSLSRSRYHRMLRNHHRCKVRHALVTCLPGLESVLSQELTRLDIAHSPTIQHDPITNAPKKSTSPAAARSSSATALTPNSSSSSTTNTTSSPTSSVSSCLLHGMHLPYLSLLDALRLHLFVGTASQLLFHIGQFRARALGELERKVVQAVKKSTSTSTLLHHHRRSRDEEEVVVEENDGKNETSSTTSAPKSSSSSSSSSKPNKKGNSSTKANMNTEWGIFWPPGKAAMTHSHSPSLTNDPIRINVSVRVRKSRLHHSGAITDRVTKAIQLALALNDQPHVTATAADTATTAAGDSDIRKNNHRDDDNATKQLEGRQSTQQPALHILVTLYHDVVNVWWDTSDTPLHRRGYRLETAKAPLREDISYALLWSAGWRPSSSLIKPPLSPTTTPLPCPSSSCSSPPSPSSSSDGLLWDPFCGSGTIVIEAASIQQGLPPGRLRPAPFLGFSAAAAATPMTSLVWTGLIQEAFTTPMEKRSRSRSSLMNHNTEKQLLLQQHSLDGTTSPPLSPPPPPPLAVRCFGSDRDAGAIQMAMANAMRAGVEDSIEWTTSAVSAHPILSSLRHPQQSLLALSSLQPSLLIASNPPFGRRTSTTTTSSKKPTPHSATKGKQANKMKVISPLLPLLQRLSDLAWSLSSKKSTLVSNSASATPTLNSPFIADASTTAAASASTLTTTIPSFDTPMITNATTTTLPPKDVSLVLLTDNPRLIRQSFRAPTYWKPTVLLSTLHGGIPVQVISLEPEPALPRR